MTETLKCPRRQKIDVVGVTPLDEHGVPTSPGVGVCSYIAHLLPVVQDKCNGRRRCKLRAGEVAVSKKQCPGVASVNFRVECVKRGIPFSFLSRATLCVSAALAVVRCLSVCPRHSCNASKRLKISQSFITAR